MKILKQKTKKFNNSYLGKVENRTDLDKMGKLQIRVYGIHNSKISKDKLPWFLPVFPITSAQYQGIGDSSIPEIGSIVAVQFINGDIMQGIYFGCVPGTNDLPNPDTYLSGKGFRTIKTPSNHKIEITDKLIRITQDDNSTIIEITDGTINIKAPNKEVNIEGKTITLQDSTNTGDILVNHQKFLTAFLNHIHPTAVGPSGTVMPATAGLKNSSNWYTNSLTVDKG